MEKVGEYMNFELFEAEEKDKIIIYNLAQLYTYELTFYEDETTNFELQENGTFKVNKYIDLYFSENNRHPYILKCNNKVAGFALERYNENEINEIAEFFVLNRYRKNGAGSFMANKIFKQYKGKWKIVTRLKNKRAQEFWRNVIKNADNKNYKEGLIKDNTRYEFYFEN